MSDSQTSRRAYITLIDGRKLPVTLRSPQPDVIKVDDMNLDTSGQYLTTAGEKSTPASSKSISAKAKEHYYDRLFIENVHLFLDKADEIMSDGRLFFAPVHIQNNLALTGTSGLQNPTIGVYLQWWLHFKEESFDENGYPIWYIAGSPLSGSHACMSVNDNNESVKAQLRVPFHEVWQSFMEINQGLTEAKQRCEAYTIEEALVELKGDDYREYMDNLLQECIMKAK